jgi:hypothetical protein
MNQIVVKKMLCHRKAVFLWALSSTGRYSASPEARVELTELNSRFRDTQPVFNIPDARNRFTDIFC